eukprot:CAMPEP_0117757610 /NCGR_PEP_ID=MMETSP0947-20121206/14844_1 /TAXON_ID=44440 /ORGANISM="Chattonella subsalsa, Strain CCMP2191" /LENGTH=243 /DNA_ID=CAMNT_0005577557 /DNA_START=127 /DNA_END=855 /DNA_ORIENTATION=+
MKQLFPMSKLLLLTFFFMVQIFQQCDGNNLPVQGESNQAQHSFPQEKKDKQPQIGSSQFRPHSKSYTTPKNFGPGSSAPPLPRNTVKLPPPSGGAQPEDYDAPPPGLDRTMNPAEARLHQAHQNPFAPHHKPNNPQVTMQAPPNVLMRSVGNSAIAVLYMILMWRSMHNYELADQIPNKIVRYCSVIPTVFLFLFNILGMMLTFLKAERQKRNMKAILNMNALNEIILVCYNLYQMVLGSNIW